MLELQAERDEETAKIEEINNRLGEIFDERTSLNLSKSGGQILKKSTDSQPTSLNKSNGSSDETEKQLRDIKDIKDKSLDTSGILSAKDSLIYDKDSSHSSAEQRLSIQDTK